MEIRYTSWTSLYDLDNPTPVSCQWSEFVTRFATHTELPVKDRAPGFGPYVLKALKHPCYGHTDGKPRTAPHRCNSCVDQITLLVFDADQGSEADIAGSHRKLSDQKIAHLWYSSFSWSPKRAAYRLVIPISPGVPPGGYSRLWSEVWHQYRVPADPKRCRGLSHFFFVPTCRPKAERRVLVGEGEPLGTALYANLPHRERPQVPWAPPPEPANLPDLVPLKATLKNKLTYLRRRDKEKALYLERCLKGEPLWPQHGNRNAAALVTSGIISWELPDQAVGTLYEIMRPSVEAMVRAGSSITEAKVCGMIRRGLYKHAQEQRAVETEMAGLQRSRRG